MVYLGLLIIFKTLNIRSVFGCAVKVLKCQLLVTLCVTFLTTMTQTDSLRAVQKKVGLLSFSILN